MRLGLMAEQACGTSKVFLTKRTQNNVCKLCLMAGQEVLMDSEDVVRAGLPGSKSSSASTLWATESRHGKEGSNYFFLYSRANNRLLTFVQYFFFFFLWGILISFFFSLFFKVLSFFQKGNQSDLSSKKEKRKQRK